MAKNPKKGVMWWLNQAINPNSALHNHLLKVYSVEKINLVCAYAAAIAERMNGRKYLDLIQFADAVERNAAKQFVNNL
jgi:predicted nucleotidyltransferase component of viral defense system